MGSFDAYCAISGVVLQPSAAVQLVMLAETPVGYRPCALPLSGAYDTYGSIGPLRWPEPADELLRYATSSALEGTDEAWSDLDTQLGAVAQTMLNPPGTVRFGDAPVSFAMIAASVAAAAAEEVEYSALPELARYHSAELAKLSLAELAALATTGDASAPAPAPVPDIVAAIEAGLAQEVAAAREAIGAFARAAAWVRRFSAWRPMEPGGQSDLDERMARCTEARERLAPHASIVAAIVALEREDLDRWREDHRRLHGERSRELQSPFGARNACRPRAPTDAPQIVGAAQLAAALHALAARDPLAAETASTTAVAIRALTDAASRLAPDALVRLVSLLEAEVAEESAEVIAGCDGTVRLERELDPELRRLFKAFDAELAPGLQLLVVTGAWATLRYLVRQDRDVRIASEQAVCAGDVLVSGALDLHVRLEVLGERAVMDRLVDEVLGLLGPCEVERDSLHAILAQLVGFAMLVERGDTALEVGAIVTMDAFAAENERVMGSGGRPATAAQVFLGLSEALTH